MLETDKNCNNLQLNVMNTNGEIYFFNLKDNVTIEYLKNHCLSYFRNPLICNNSFLFRLVSTFQKRPLQDNCSLKEEKIEDGDYLIIKTKANSLISNYDKKLVNISKQEIAEITKFIPSKNLKDKLTLNQYDNQITCIYKDIRKILISLIDYQENLLKNHPDIERILNFNFDEKSFDFFKDDKTNENALKNLIEMGFSEKRSKQALKLNNQNPIESMDWLLAYHSSKNKNEKQKSNFQFDSNYQEIYKNVPKIINCYRQYKRNTFFYNKKSFENLKKMGFDENEIFHSLWVYNNNETLACEWLISNRKPKNEELEIGLPKDSSLYKSLITNPIIQQGLIKPKVFFALLHLIEEPNANRWFNEQEIFPVVSQIFRIYHSEKQSIHFIQKQNNQKNKNLFLSEFYTNENSEIRNQNDYSTFIIPEIFENLSLNEQVNQERNIVEDDWNLIENNISTLV